MGDLTAGLALTPSLITKAVSQGISGGFNGLGHTVDVWLFGIAGGMLLFLLFGAHLLAMLHALTTWLQLNPTAAHQAWSVVHSAPTTGQAYYALWAPGSYTLTQSMHASGATSGTALAIGWSPAWAVLVGGVWVIGLVLGVLALFRGKRLGQPIMIAAPLMTGIMVFATPYGLPALLTAIWHLVGTQGLMAALGRTIGLTATQSQQWIPNPFWDWGALFGVSGAHGLALNKFIAVIGTPAALGTIVGLGHFLSTVIGTTSGQMTVDGAVSSWIYTFFHVAMVVTIAQTVLLALWSLLLFSAALWLGLSPAWVWIVALDPWSFDLAALLGGLVFRAVLVQAGAWVWIAGVVLLDGGSQHGPFGLPIAFAGLTPWLSMAWTLIGIVLVWRLWIVPLWLLLRRVHVDVVTWWTQTQRQWGEALGQTGVQWQVAGQRLEALGDQIPTGLSGDLGQYLRERGQAAQAAGAALQTVGETAAVEAAWRGMQAQWTEGEQAAANRSQFGMGDAAWAHPAGWAMAEAGGDAAPTPADAWPLHWQHDADANHWQARAASPDHARKLTADLAPRVNQEGEKYVYALAMQRLLEDGTFQENLKEHVSERDWADERRNAAKKIGDAWLKELAQNIEPSPVQLPNKQLQASPAVTMRPNDLAHQLPRITSEGNILRISGPPPIVQRVVGATPSALLPRERQRYGQTEVYKQGLWVAQSGTTKGEDR
ncbi:MAG: hypothetical protein M0Z36_09955 [Thermaerobacter sp.]|nr:hypothetical protein [Thermaerobacter sp.]